MELCCCEDRKTDDGCYRKAEYFRVLWAISAATFLRNSVTTAILSATDELTGWQGSFDSGTKKCAKLKAKLLRIFTVIFDMLSILDKVIMIGLSYSWDSCCDMALSILNALQNADYDHYY